MKRILLVIFFCAICLTGCKEKTKILVDIHDPSVDPKITQQIEKAFCRYRCEKGHLSEGLALTVSSNGKPLFEMMTCPECIREWADKYLPKVKEIK